MLAPTPSEYARDTRPAGVLFVDRLRTLARAATALMERRARERRIARDVRYLNAFDDRMLADIGLTRPDLESAVRKTAMADGHGRPCGYADALQPLPSVFDRVP